MVTAGSGLFEQSLLSGLFLQMYLVLAPAEFLGLGSDSERSLPEACSLVVVPVGLFWQRLLAWVCAYRGH